jgi:tetratricopeptide (TPR) repeat protein
VILALTVVLPVCAQPRKATVPVPPANLAMHTQMVVPSLVPAPSKERLQNLAKGRFPRSHYELGMYLKEHDAVDAALVEFLKATQDNPKDYKAFYEQALIFQGRGFLKLAESSLQQAIEADNDVKHNWQARILLAAIRVQQGNLEQALGELTQILGITPPKALPYKVVRTEKDIQHDDTEKLLASIPVMQMPHGALPVPQVEVAAQSPADLPPSNEILRGLTAADLNKATRTVVTHHSHDEAGKMIADASSSYTDDAVERILAETRAEAKRVHEQKSGGFMSMFRREPEKKSEEDPITARQKAVDQVIREQAAKLNEKLAHQQASAEQPKKNRRSFMGSLMAWRNSEPQKEESSSVVIKPSSAPEIALSAHRALPAATHTSAAAQSKILPVEAPRVSQVQVSPPEAPAYIAPKVQEAPRQAAKTTGTRPKKSQASQPGSLALSYHQQRTSEQEAQYEAELNQIRRVNDPWTLRLTYLSKNGTSTLKEGEAFMFSEETGEATLFLTDGQVITRRIGDGHQPEDVALMRRPDVMMPEDNTYNISLLGKILPKSGAKKQPNQSADDPVGGVFKAVKGVFGL